MLKVNQHPKGAQIKFQHRNGIEAMSFSALNFLDYFNAPATRQNAQKIADALPHKGAFTAINKSGLCDLTEIDNIFDSPAELQKAVNRAINGIRQIRRICFDLRTDGPIDHRLINRLNAEICSKI